MVTFICYRELSILLDAEKEADVELTISYVVSKAKWSPKYDIRVFSNDQQLKVGQSRLYLTSDPGLL